MVNDDQVRALAREAIPDHESAEAKFVFALLDVVLDIRGWLKAIANRN